MNVNFVTSNANLIADLLEYKLPFLSSPNARIRDIDMVWLLK
jgi:hypothetical protein